MVQVAVGKLENVVADAVEEGTVVGDHQQGDVGGGEVVLQPFGHLDVEVVGGLVEDEQVGVGDERFGERSFLPLTAGEFAHVLQHIVNAEFGENLLHL